MDNNETDLSNEMLERMTVALSRAAEAVTGIQGSNPLDVFPDPASVDRREDVQFSVNPVDESGFRSAMAELGIGRETNKGAEMVGLQDGYVALLEGGQGHKMIAELNVVRSDSITPGVIVLAASKERALPEAETKVTARVFGIEEDEVGANEYEVARQVVARSPEFVAEPETELPFGYDISGEITDEPTGQFVRIGTINGSPVILMRVDREYYTNEAGERKYRQPGNYEKMLAVARIEKAQGNDQALGFVTSSTYEASCSVDALRTNEQVVVLSYGMQELADVKGEAMASQPKLNQLAGEAFKTAQQLQKLAK